MLSTVMRRLAHPRLLSQASSRRGMAAVAEHIPDQSIDSPTELLKDFDDPGIRSELNQIHEAENELLQAVSVKADPIDWSHWNDQIKYPGLVDDMKEAFDAYPVPDMEEEKKKMIEKIDVVFKPIIDSFSSAIEASEAETKVLEERVEELKFLRDNLDELPLEEYLKRYPGIKKSLEEQIANNKWFLNDS